MLWGRVYTVTVDTIRTSDLDVRFRVTKTLEPEPNTCDIYIYNLNEEHRRHLAMVSSGWSTEIDAGYQDNHGRIYKGQLREVSSYKEGPDWITELHSGDSEDLLATARINKSYSKGTSIEAIIKDAVSALGIAAGNAWKAAKTGNMAEAGRQFLNGTTVSGSASKELTRVLRSIGKQWSIQDGEVQVIDAGTCLPGPTIRLDPDTGLIGSPAVGSDGVLKLRALLNHEIVPGRALQVESDEISEAYYRVERVDYTGDSAGTDWYTDVEAALYVPALFTF